MKNCYILTKTVLKLKFESELKINKHITVSCQDEISSYTEMDFSWLFCKKTQRFLLQIDSRTQAKNHIFKNHFKALDNNFNMIPYFLNPITTSEMVFSYVISTNLIKIRLSLCIKKWFTWEWIHLFQVRPQPNAGKISFMRDVFSPCKQYFLGCTT